MYNRNTIDGLRTKQSQHPKLGRVAEWLLTCHGLSQWTERVFTDFVQPDALSRTIETMQGQTTRCTFTYLVIAGNNLEECETSVATPPLPSDSGF